MEVTVKALVKSSDEPKPIKAMPTAQTETSGAKSQGKRLTASPTTMKDLLKTMKAK